MTPEEATCSTQFYYRALFQSHGACLNSPSSSYTGSDVVNLRPHCTESQNVQPPQFNRPQTR